MPDILAGTRDGWILAIKDGSVGTAESKTTGPSFRVINANFGRLDIRRNLSSDTPVSIEVFSITGQRLLQKCVLSHGNFLSPPLESISCKECIDKIFWVEFDEIVDALANTEIENW